MSTPPPANPFWIPLLKPNNVGIYGGGDMTFFSGKELLTYILRLLNQGHQQSHTGTSTIKS
jgi:hypothetical protein